MEKLHCHVCDLDVYVNDGIFVGKGKLPIEVETHMQKPEHKRKQQELKDSISKVKDGGQSILEHWRL